MRAARVGTRDARGTTTTTRVGGVGGVVARRARRVALAMRAARVKDDDADAEQTTTTTTTTTTTRRRARVAIVGAGAAGLSALRAMRRQGHDARAFEVADSLGGTWRYDGDEATASKSKAPTPMYASLRTNLPREVMGFREFPFDATGERGGDMRRFCGREEVRRYLQRYAETFGLERFVEYDARVTSVVRAVRESAEEEARWSSAWEVVWKSGKDDETRREMFDAVVVANGHYNEPRVPEFDGAQTWPGERMHSHEYRIPNDTRFVGKKVLLIGAMASGEDISREIAEVASTVYLSARTWQNPEWAKSTEGIGARGNIFRKPNVKRFESDGSVVFEDDTVAADCDVCVFCTGYKYRFEFLPQDLVSVEDNYVAPLYEHCISVNAPSMSFVGLPWKVVPFPMFELQSEWIARMLSGVVPMPTREECARGAAELDAKLEPHGEIPRRHAHMFGDAQFAYNDRIASLAGVEVHASWRARMYKATGQNKRAHPEKYRDANMPDAAELEEARREFETIVY